MRGKNVKNTTISLPIEVLTILPVRPIGTGTISEICEVLQAKGIQAVPKPPILRPRGAYDAGRHQFRAEVLLERARSCAARPILAVTDADCYGGNLNFVLGMAEVGGRVALVSTHRLRAASTRNAFRQRLVKELMHELGHGEGLGHCGDPKCVMHFSNSLTEVDAKSGELCAGCVRRLGLARAASGAA
jgi:archaemetzincin